MLTLEFLLWSNCPNNCKFCWQRLFDDKTTWLNEEQKLDSIAKCSKMIDQKEEECDILIVGGEVYADQGEKVNAALNDLYVQIAERIKAEKVRFLYANTNLTYPDRTNLVNLLNAFEGIEDNLRFTTSYDLDGRFNRLNESEMKTGCAKADRKEMFLDNLRFINDEYPKIRTVVNTIITRAVVDATLYAKDGEKYDPLWFMDEFSNTVYWVNLIPYIPIKGDTSLDVRFSETVKVLDEANKKSPGYLLNYIQQLDFNQDKELHEYHSDRGYIENTAKTLPCGHNENFSMVNRSGECYICRLKEYYVANQDRLEAMEA